jgi:tetratricopeptide (TPR) repeat protein
MDTIKANAELRRGIKRALVAVALACSLCCAGCAGSITQWMIGMRNSQGDTALANGNVQDAEKEYRLALALNPHNSHARAGLAEVLYLTAKQDFAGSKLDEAALEIGQSLQYGPDNAAALALSNEIGQAKIRREIVISNYPLYGSINAALAPAFKAVSESNYLMAKEVKAFANDFDTAHLTKAIANSYDLEDEIHRIRSRLITYRAYVLSGSAKATSAAGTSGPALLPIP